MASYSDISATSYCVNAGSQSKIVCFSVNDNFNVQHNIERKIYCPVFINKLRVVACIDNGSDLSVMQYSLFKSIFLSSARAILKTCQLKTIKSFSANSIDVYGQFKCMLGFSMGGPVVSVNITVIADIIGVPLFLFGNDSLRTTWAALAFVGDKEDPQPEFIVKNPIEQNVPVYYVPPREIYTCTANIYLKPFEIKTVEFTLNKAAPVLRYSEILITNIIWGEIHVYPSKSDLIFDRDLDCYIASGLVVNLTKFEVEQDFQAKFEILGSHQSIPLNLENKGRLMREMKRFPPAREIFPSPESFSLSIPVITVCNVAINTEGEIDKEDLKHIAGISKVSYSGTAEISSEIIDAGLEIPNAIHSSPEEALNLELFEPEIRPFLSDLFLVKYRDTVSLHPMDAGDISKTLGYLSLRLIPGEVLPRHKRIFHLSPQDNAYLEELLDQFIRFNFMIRAPVDAGKHHHLYGMSAYLIPRKKPTDLPRLIIDYSPLTTIIQSPPSIVPDINAALQNLKGKAMFSTMDMRQGYYALRLDEKSRAYTTFITPCGAYQLLTLPTGAAVSPAYFLETMNKILKYRPVLDKDGNPVFEEPNKVKLEWDVIHECFCYMDDISCGSKLCETYEETLIYHFQCLDKILQRLAFHNIK